MTRSNESPREYLVIDAQVFDDIRALARHRLQDDAVAVLDEVSEKASRVQEGFQPDDEPKYDDPPFVGLHR